jgi:hypothetical protein
VIGLALLGILIFIAWFLTKVEQRYTRREWFGGGYDYGSGGQVSSWSREVKGPVAQFAGKIYVSIGCLVVVLAPVVFFLALAHFTDTVIVLWWIALVAGLIYQLIKFASRAGSWLDKFFDDLTHPPR